ncbi:FUSC family protein, partial [Francisella tularensis subsp. holarctica]|nr:FUSC family protein [Francisella tularensis subsp. holarctica]
GIFIALFILLLIEIGERILDIISESLGEYIIKQLLL